VFEKAVPRCMFGPRKEEEEEPMESCIAGSFMFCILLLTEYYWDNQTEDEMGGACDIHGALMGKTESKYYLEGVCIDMSVLL
jgi:hypothetical protein